MVAITILGSLAFLALVPVVFWLESRAIRREQERVWARIEAWLAEQEHGR